MQNNNMQYVFIGYTLTMTIGNNLIKHFLNAILWYNFEPIVTFFLLTLAFSFLPLSPLEFNCESESAPFSTATASFSFFFDLNKPPAGKTAIPPMGF